MLPMRPSISGTRNLKLALRVYKRGDGFFYAKNVELCDLNYMYISMNTLKLNAFYVNSQVILPFHMIFIEKLQSGMFRMET